MGSQGSSSEYDFVWQIYFFPININNNNWVLVVAKIETKKLRYNDTYHGDGGRYVCSMVEAYFSMEWDSLVSSSEHQLNTNGTLVYDSHHTPYQHDSFSCGVFILAKIEEVIKGLPLELTEADMQETYRKYSAGELFLESDN